MAGKSSIEWTERTWNPIVGCSILTPGCTNCYAMKMAARIEAMKRSHYDGTTRKVKGNAVWTGKLALAPESILLEPLRRKKPTTYFVNSMGDLFHEDAPNEWIDKVSAVMALSPQHTFQVLTKRAERMRAYCAATFSGLTGPRLSAVCKIIHATAATERDAYMAGGRCAIGPLPNVWLGVSTERQQEADERIPLLLQTPAAVRFISAEPLLGPIDLQNLALPKDWERCTCTEHEPHLNVLTSSVYCEGCCEGPEALNLGRLDWVIAGGESGPNARPMRPDWARQLRDDCADAEVAFFFKQWGSWTPGENVERQRGIVDTAHWFNDRWRFETENLANCEGHVDDQPDVYCVGKKEAGRKLDGIEHNAMPERAST